MEKVIKFLFVSGIALTTASEILRQYNELIRKTSLIKESDEIQEKEN